MNSKIYDAVIADKTKNTDVKSDAEIIRQIHEDILNGVSTRIPSRFYELGYIRGAVNDPQLTDLAKEML